MVRCYTMLDPKGNRSAIRMERKRSEMPAGLFRLWVEATLADLRAMGCTRIRRVGERQWRAWQ